MSFSRLFAFLFLLGIIPVLIGSLIGIGLYILIGYNLILFVMYFVDAKITPWPSSFEFERECDEKLSLGIDNEVIIKIRNNSDYHIYMEIRDDIPDYFKVDRHLLEIDIEPHFDNRVLYNVIPIKRGNYLFGDVHFRYPGVLKLCRKQGVSNLKNEYKVYPNLKDLRKYTLKSIKKINQIQGNKNIRKYGIGTEFESLKEYVEGDDYKKINWTSTARQNKIIVNSYEPEKNQNVFVIIDTSRVMNTEIDNIKKLDYSINSAFTLTQLALENGDNVGLMVFDNEVKRFVKPGKGIGHFQIIAENLYDIHESFVTSNYEESLKYLNNFQKRRSLLCIFTEPLNSEETISLAKKLKTFAKRHLPIVIAVKDSKINYIANKKVSNSYDVYNKSAALKLVEEREKMINIYKQYGIIYIDTEPDKLSIEVLNSYLNIKERNLL